jgi:AcrR family transcriptional regulator
MTHMPGVRREQKQRTRQALLDAALELLEHQSLSSLGIREVTRRVGIAPAGFYRHFHDMDELGVALVQESFGSVRAMLDELGEDTEPGTDPDVLLRRTVDVVARYVRTHASHFRFVARERHGGVGPVRSAIRDELGQLADRLAADLATDSPGWSDADLHMLAELIVNHLVATATAVLEAAAEGPDAERAVLHTAHRQLTLISRGRNHWLDRRS